MYLTFRKMGRGATKEELDIHYAPRPKKCLALKIKVAFVVYIIPGGG